MAHLEVNCYSSESLSHSVRKGLLIGEASDIGYQGVSRLYDDAGDVGLALRNPRTGNVTRWFLITEMRDPRENELLGWSFGPAPETVRKHPELATYQFNLVND